MTNFIPIFPLSIVVYPGESLNLHIYEPRYKELVNECFKNKRPFGIPPVINEKLSDVGCLVEIVDIVKEYENGEMDIVTKGTDVFRILELIKTLPEKLYSGAIVNYPDNVTAYPKKDLMMLVTLAVRELHRLLEISKDFKKPDEQLVSYDVAHHAGLSLVEEYELLCLLREEQRQEYLKRHLSKVTPVITEMETLKERVKLNGHFKNISPFRFEE